MFDVMVVFYKIGKERLSKAFDPISLFPEITALPSLRNL